MNTWIQSKHTQKERKKIRTLLLEPPNSPRSIPSLSMIMYTERIAPAATGGIKNWFTCSVMALFAEKYTTARALGCVIRALWSKCHLSLYVAPDPERFIGCVCRPCVCGEYQSCWLFDSRWPCMYMNNTDAVPSLKGHQQKPTYVEHDSRLLAVFILPPPKRCAKLKLVEISLVWLVFCSYWCQSSLFQVVWKAILQYKNKPFILNWYYDTIWDCIVGVANHFVVTQACHWISGGFLSTSKKSNLI